MSIEQELASVIRGIKYEDLSQETVERVKMILLHDLIVGLWGKSSPVFTSLSRLYQSDDPVNQVFLQSLSMSSRANEDFYGANHLGPLIIPNIMLKGKQYGVSGQQMISSIVAAYETGIWLFDRLGSSAGQKGFRGTPLFGIMAAAAGVSHVAGDFEQNMLDTLSHAYANAFGIGISLVEGTDEWRYQAALGAYHVYLSHEATIRGMKGYPQFLTGTGGFAEVFAGSKLNQNMDIDIHVDGESVLKVGVKRHPVHIFVLSPLEACIRFVRKYSYNPKEITSVKVWVPNNQMLPLNVRSGPYVNPNQAILSIPTILAIALLNKKFKGDMLSQANDPDVLQLVQKIEVAGMDELNDYQTKLEITINEKKYMTMVCDTDSLYFPPIELEKERLNKEMTEWGIDRIHLDYLMDCLLNLEGLPSIETFVDEYFQMFNTI